MLRQVVNNVVGDVIGRRGGSAGPDAPLGLTLTVVDSTTLLASFSSTSTNQDGYRTYVGTDNISFPLTFTGASPVSITGLSANTLYYAYTVAYKGATESARSNVAYNSTNALPSTIAGLTLWMRADSVAGADGDAIAQWVSKEGNNYAFDAAATKQPLLKLAANGINGKPVLRFDGTNDIMIHTAAVLAGTTGTVVGIVRLTAALKANQDLLVSADQATAGTYTINFTPYHGDTALAQPNMRFYKNNNNGANVDDTISYDSVVAGIVYLMVWQSDGSDLSMYLNGVLQELSLNSGINSGDWFGDVLNKDNLTIGGAKVTVEANFLKGDVAEILVYDSKLSLATLEDIVEYSRVFYGLKLLVTFGDSTTAGYGLTNDSKKWSSLVANNKGYILRNSGISFTTLQNTVQNTVSTIGGPVDGNGRDTYEARINAYNPDYVCIMYGLNDLRLNDAAYTADLFENDLTEVVAGVIAHGVDPQKIVIGSPPHMTNYDGSTIPEWNGGSDAKNQAYGLKCAAVATALGTKYIDVLAWMKANGGDALVNVADGIHPNDNGHIAIANAFLSVL